MINFSVCMILVDSLMFTSSEQTELSVKSGYILNFIK